MSTSPTSLWRVVAYTVLFWLFRHVARPLAKYALLLLAAAAFLLVSPLVLTSKAYHAARPLLHRMAAAVLLVFCQPRPLDGPLYDFVKPLKP